MGVARVAVTDALLAHRLASLACNMAAEEVVQTMADARVAARQHLLARRI